MAASQAEQTLVILKPDSFWRGIHQPVAARIRGLGLEVVAEFTLGNGDNLPEEKWREFYFPAIGDRPPILTATSRYMAHGPVHVMHLRGADAVKTVRQAIGSTRPWQADKGTIRGDFRHGSEAVDAPFLEKFSPPGDKHFFFNLVHASDSPASFQREALFFEQLKGA